MALTWVLAPILVVTLWRLVFTARRVRAYQQTPLQLREPRVLVSDLFGFALWMGGVGFGVLLLAGVV